MVPSLAEGVLVAKKDFNAPKHEELDVPNLQVIKALQSLTSKGLVKTQFSWQWYYYTLTPEGVEYLREWYVLSICYQCQLNGYLFLGSTYPTKLSQPLTKRPLVLPVLLVYVQVEGMVLTGLLVVIVVATVNTEGRRRELPVSSDHSSLVSAGVHQGSEVVVIESTGHIAACVSLT